MRPHCHLRPIPLTDYAAPPFPEAVGIADIFQLSVEGPCDRATTLARALHPMALTTWEWAAAHREELFRAWFGGDSVGGVSSGVVVA